MNIYFSKTFDGGFDALIERLKKNREEGTHHIFIVPDRMTVFAEKRIFEKLNISSTCDIEVLTISRLASRVINNTSYIKKTSSCMIVQKILKEERKNLKCFLAPSYSDAENIFGIISQFKSCKIAPSEVKAQNTNTLLKNKLYDISLIYEKYNRELKSRGLSDNLDKLDFLKEALNNCDFIKNSYFYVSNFDSFTYQGYDIIFGLSKLAKEFNIALPNTNSSRNKHIYNEKYIDNILSLNTKKEVFFDFTKESDTKEFLKDNLFSFSNLKVKNNDFAHFFEGKDFRQEANFCLSTIKNLLYNGASFNDFSIAVANLQGNYLTLQKELLKYNFSYFIDIEEPFENSVLSRFIRFIFDLKNEKSSENIKKVIKNPLFCADFNEIEDFEDVIQKYSLDFEDFDEIDENYFASSNELFQKLKTLFAILKKFENEGSYNDFIQILNEILTTFNVDNTLNEMILNFSKTNLKEAKIYEQYLNKLDDILNNLSNILGTEPCDFEMFFSTLFAGIKVEKISTAPLSSNAIYIGDASSSFFEKRKYLFILNAGEKDFPKTIQDCGLITDKDIDEVSVKYKLEPTIMDINKKERFKAFDLILKPEKLYVSYNYFESLKSNLYNDLNNFLVNDFGKNEEILTFYKLDLESINNSLEVAKLNLIENIRAFYDGAKDIDKDDSKLFLAVKENLKYLENFNFINKKTLNFDPFFSKNTISVSQVESFMTCPFLHFVRYGLKLKEKEDGEFSVRFIGILMHELAQKLAPKIPLCDTELEKETRETFRQILEEEKYKSLKSNLKNKILLKNLENESLVFAKNLNKNAEYSSFKPKYFEVRFDDKGIISGLKIKTKKGILSLVGQIDRIDIFEDYFRIIDYKTGSCDTSLKELFFGKKIQLEAYLKVVENSLKLKPAGAYYMPIKSRFLKENEKDFGLKGRSVDDYKVAYLSDKRFLDGAKTSDLVEIKFNTNDGEKVVKNAYSKVLDEKNFDKLGIYALKLIERAVDDILKLDITPSPCDVSKNPCKNCLYHTLCNFDESFKNRTRSPKIKDVESLILGEGVQK